ncbi:hypothetical protein CMU68_10600 [Elizabethkingia anophelis]|nr:hypothetical protein [Elizabethkingia anophelis]MDV3678811.1 hypothetical protein [Elizabethkingia anophelis]
MDNKFSNIKERILQIANNQDISYEKFCEKIGVTYGNFKGENKKRPINSNILENILSIYPNVNPSWLLTGQGKMLIEEDSYIEELISPNNDKEVELLQKQIALLEENKILLQDKISFQAEKLKQFEKEIEDLKKATKRPEFGEKPVKH